QSSEPRVGVGEVGGEALHESSRQRPLVIIQISPGGHPRRAGREPGPRWYEAQVELAREGADPPVVPAAIESPPVAIDPVAWRVVRRVAGAGAEVEEEPLVGV